MDGLAKVVVVLLKVSLSWILYMATLVVGVYLTNWFINSAVAIEIVHCLRSQSTTCEVTFVSLALINGWLHD